MPQFVIILFAAVILISVIKMIFKLTFKSVIVLGIIALFLAMTKM